MVPSSRSVSLAPPPGVNSPRSALSASWNRSDIPSATSNPDPTVTFSQPSGAQQRADMPRARHATARHGARVGALHPDVASKRSAIGTISGSRRIHVDACGASHVSRCVPRTHAAAVEP